MSRDTSSAPLVLEPQGPSQFVANYPPFSAWSESAVTRPPAVLGHRGEAPTPLGVYVHVPFCRKRCSFCYYKVYTGQNARQVDSYVDAVIREAALLSAQPAISGRPATFLYLGGGTPSYLSVRQLRRLLVGLSTLVTPAESNEFTLECEPGTMTAAKASALVDLGVTRLSVGVESLDDRVLELNGRAHRLRHVEQAWAQARQSSIPQLNIDLICGLMGETDTSWARGIERLITMEPDSATIYQLELPPNTTLSRALAAGELSPTALPDWATKHRWYREAFDTLEAAGYTLVGGDTATRAPDAGPFVYRQRLWHGADMLGLGVSAFSHVAGTHYQNEKRIERYLERIDAGELPVARGYVMTDDERLVREAVLALKTGELDLRRLSRRFGVAARERFSDPIEALVQAGLATLDDEHLRLVREAALQVDRLLPTFFAPEHREERVARGS